MRHLMEALGGQGRLKEAKDLNKEGWELVKSMSTDMWYAEEKPAEIEAMREVEEKLKEWSKK